MRRNVIRHWGHKEEKLRRLHFFVALVVVLNLFVLSRVIASNNSESKNILLGRITKVHPKWQFIKEKEIEGSQLLVMAQNPLYPQLRPVWLIKKGVIYSINGAAKTLTADFQFSYDITPSDAIDIIEGRKIYKSIPNSKGKTWNTPQEALEVLKMHGFITEKETAIMKKFDEYIDDPKNSDSKAAVEKWALKNNITRNRLNEIDSMRYGYKSTESIVQAGFVRVGEKKQIREIGQPTGMLIKKFDVSFERITSNIYIQVQTDLPDESPLMFSISKTGLKDDDKWIGNQAKTLVKKRKAEVNIPLATHRGEPLKKGNYDIEIFFNSFWSAFQKDVDPNVKAKVGEFGENLKTSFNGIFEREGKKYRTIDYKKRAAFSVQ